ncbi:MAG: sugar ABC transporter permease [Clostridia bacterium]|nr:sugar ABC transporter permease [Clostridia bacterium]MBR0189977.1 sugar ABC transporter permease [Clostridia bacterium]
MIYNKNKNSEMTSDGRYIIKENKINWAKLFPYIVLLPGVINFLIFYVYVNFNSILLAFTVPTADGGQVFSLLNFKQFFETVAQEIVSPIEGEYGMVDALLNTFKYFFINVFKTFLTAVVAYFLFKKVYLSKAYKILFFLPSMIPGMVYIMVFKNFISIYGPMWSFVRSVFGVTYSNLLTNPDTATNVILFYCLWSGFGAQMLIFVGCMNRIPNSVLEAALLDGCTTRQEFFKIVMPLIWSTVSTYILIGIGCIFQATGPILYFTGGDATTNTQTLGFWIFLRVRAGSTNYPAAVGLIFTLLGIPLVIMSKKIMNKIETPEY